MNVYIYLGACSHVSVEGHSWCHVSSGSLSMLYDTASLAEPRAHYFCWSRYSACFRVLRLSPLCHRIADRLSELHGLYVGSGDPRPHPHACWVIFPALPLEFYIWREDGGRESSSMGTAPVTGDGGRQKLTYHIDTLMTSKLLCSP